MKQIPQMILLSVQRALVGAIYPELVSVAVGYDRDKRLTIRYYIDRPPEESDFEELGVVMTEVLSDLPPEVVASVSEECEEYSGLLRDLDILGGLVFARRQ